MRLSSRSGTTWTPSRGGDPIERSPILALTGLRSVFAGSVLVFHFFGFLEILIPSVVVVGPLREVGWIGVDGFFLLSGFVLAHNYGATVWSRANLLSFFRNRFARVYPVYFVCTALAGLLVLVALALGRAPSALGDFSWGSGLANALLVQAWFVPPLPSWNAPSWSVSCEALAYLAFPLLVVGAARVRRPALWLIALLFVPVAFAFAGVQLGHLHVVRIAAEFPAGILLYRVRADVPRAAVGLGLVGAVVAAAWGVSSGRASWGLLAVPFLALVVLAAARADPSWLRSPFAVFWGKASYSLYLIHALVFAVFLKAIDASAWSMPLRGAYAAAAFAATLVAAWLLLALVEEPCRAWLRHGARGLRRNTRTPEPATGEI